MNTKVRNWIIVGAVVIVAIFAFFMYRNASATASQASASGSVNVVSVEVGETVEASGKLEAQPFASLTWKTEGVVAKINVQVGDFVKKGDILLALQPESTSANIVSAQADLINAQKELENIINSGTSLAQAKIDLNSAQEAYNKAVYYLKYLNNDTKIPQTLYTAKLEQTRNGWEYKYETENFRGPAPKEWIIDAENDLALKKGKLEDAQREYDRLLAGEESVDVLAARAKVEAAQATVNSLYILAPFDGQVLSVDNHVGDTVSTNDLSVNMANLNNLYVETKIDESDIANVKLGNQVEVTLDALDGVVFTGRVTAINPVGEVVSDLVKYAVRIDLDKSAKDLFLPLGATADVVIVVKEPSASLAVPITAIQNDGKSEFVTVIAEDGSTKRVDVVSGAIVGDLVVVTGELDEGDSLQIISASGEG